MIKELIKIANALDAAGRYAAAQEIDDIILALASDKPDWLVNPNHGLAPGEVAAIGYSEIVDGDIDRGRLVAQEQAKAKIRAQLGSGGNYQIELDDSFEYYEPNMVESPEKVWVRAVVLVPAQG